MGPAGEDQLALLLLLLSLGRAEPAASPDLSVPPIVRPAPVAEVVLGTWLPPREAPGVFPVEIRLIPGRRPEVLFAYVTLGPGTRGFRTLARITDEGIQLDLRDTGEMRLRLAGPDRLVGEVEADPRPVELVRFKRLPR